MSDIKGVAFRVGLDTVRTNYRDDVWSKEDGTKITSLEIVDDKRPVVRVHISDGSYRDYYEVNSIDYS